MANFERIIKWVGIKNPDVEKKLEKPWEENGELIYPANKTRQMMQKRYEAIAQNKKYTVKESLLDEEQKNILPLMKNRTYVEKIFIPASNDKTNKKFIVDEKTDNVFGAIYKKGECTVKEYFNVFDKKLNKYINIRAILKDNAKDGGYDVTTVWRTDAATNEILEFLDEQKLSQVDQHLIT